MADDREGLKMEEGTEKWIKHYSSKQRILLVGEGNFSFSLSLARAFGSAANMTATSLDSNGKLERDYGAEAMTNIEELKTLGCTVMHGVNVRIMSRHSGLCSKRYDRIVFNFPHAGFDVIGSEHDCSTIKKHQGLVRGFLENARRMVDVDGEVHVTHKTTYPFSEWDLEGLGEEESLCLVEKVPFYKSDYPGYVDKKGSGGRCNSTFPVGDSSTFMFRKCVLERIMSFNLND